jgi:citrate lyase subunit beta / citryl-CoA lyase
MLAIHPAQVDVINAAFTPTAEELADAQAIVDLFAANPGVGAIGYQGAMLDRPHLARAQALLAQSQVKIKSVLSNGPLLRPTGMA